MKCWVLLTLAAAGCGGGNIGSFIKPAHCSMTSTGAVSASFACHTVAATFSASANKGGFSGLATAPGLSFHIGVGTDEQPNVKVYDDSTDTVIPGTGVTLTNSGTGGVWAAAAGSSGNFSLTVSSLNDTVQVFGGAEWPQISGTLTATLEPQNGAATGTVTITATFF
jgi:hypothetical protein